MYNKHVKTQKSITLCTSSSWEITIAWQIQAAMTVGYRFSRNSPGSPSDRFRRGTPSGPMTGRLRDSHECEGAVSASHLRRRNGKGCLRRRTVIFVIIIVTTTTTIIITTTTTTIIIIIIVVVVVVVAAAIVILIVVIIITVVVIVSRGIITVVIIATLLCLFSTYAHFHWVRRERMFPVIDKLMPTYVMISRAIP